MARVPVYDLGRKPVGEVDLPDAIFAAEVHEAVLYDVVKAQLASRRRGTASTKSRAEVSGSTRKLGRQKGMGRARHGAIRAPIFVGGASQHGPKPRSYAYRPPRKMRVRALCSALSAKLREGRLLVVDRFELEQVKTRVLAAALERLQVGDGSLIVDRKDNEGLRRSARNLAGHLVLPPEGVNPYDVLRHAHLVLTRDAVDALTARLGAIAERLAHSRRLRAKAAAAASLEA
ncbi:MAG: 50S ribosomal protein L4 [Myxococcota bacterium]|nr:50S ribosomal protein L4 [Myxococcota bacterium]MDW8363248.1 50S ribosomal protein L4 [Myxococcales bacterium]